MSYQSYLAQADTAQGNPDPTLAFGLDNYAAWAPVSQFLDITKSMRPWEADAWTSTAIKYDDLKAGGYLDDKGWVKEIPEGASNVTTTWQWGGRSELAEDVRGVYVLEYDGTGEVVIEGDARIISNDPGRIVFENMDGGNLFMSLSSTDPEGTGDYVRNMSIVAEKNLPLFEAGAIYNPAWLELIEDARELRFLGWNDTNNATLISWDERSQPDGTFWDGVPVEYQVQLANELGVDPWFTIPHTADADYIRNFATYVRDNLDPGLKAKVEYSNEAWNWAFEQTSWLHDKAVEDWGVTGAQNEYYVKKSVETALIWQEVFGDEADARLVNILATQTVNTGLTERMLNAETWKANEPENFVDPASVFEELAVTTYFGNATVSNSELRAELIAAIQNPDVDATAYLAAKLMDPDYLSSIPQIADRLAANAALAEEYGLKLSAYEGGQHVHHSFAVRDLSSDEIAALQDFMVDFVRSDEMGALYQELWDVWAQYSDGPFMQFGDVGTPSKWGSWSLYAGLEDSTPRSEALEELNSTTAAWWEDDRDGSQFQQGLVSEGSEDADLLIGTSKIDYLLGMGGDDILVGGQGNDGLNGGEGIDRAVFSGAFSDYTVRIEGDGYRVEGLDGSDFLINVEELAFANEQVIFLSDLIERDDGTLGLVPQDDPVPEPEPEPEPEPIVFRPGTLVGGQIKDGTIHESVTIDDFSGTGEGIVIRTIWGASKIGPDLDLGNFREVPSYLTFAQNSHDFAQLVQLVDESLTEEGQFTFEIHDAAIVTQASEIVATAGNDSFFGGLANDVVFGADGNDHLVGANGNDILHGDDGDDRLIGSAGDDALYGGAGDDRINGGLGYDTIEGGLGNDTVYAGLDDDIIRGGGGNDVISGEDGSDTLFGGGDNDVVHGGEGDDTVLGENGDDQIYGGNGADRLIGGQGDDEIHGGNDDDQISGNIGNDLIYGGHGNDQIYAQEDNDTVYGGEGNDYISGQGGDDTLVGGTGDDRLTGGTGKDQFIFVIGDGDDQISDFSQEDTLDLTGFFLSNQALEDFARLENGNLVLSNGEDRITLLGLEEDDLSWMNIDIV